MTTTLSAPRVVTQDDVLSPGHVVIDGDRIADVRAGRPAPARGHVRFEDGLLIPGLVDLQVNGVAGIDFYSCDVDGWRAALAALPGTGVTSCLPTLISAPIEGLVAAMEVSRLITGDEQRPTGARVLGVHLEGPFLAPARRGAHAAQHLAEPTAENVAALFAGSARPALVTLAPELPGGLAAIRSLTTAGVAVSIGHSNATAEETRAAFDAGATLVTHLFNAQRGLNHREPGVVGAALADPRATSGLILDLEHVAADAARVAFAAAPGRIALVTDAVAAAGRGAGRYRLGDDDVDFDGTSAPRRADGTLAGSALRLDTAVRNAITIGLPLPVAVAAASAVPASALGRSDIGRLAPGALADIVWTDDDLTTRAAWIGGAYIAGEAPP